MSEASFRTDVLPLKNELFRLAMRITLNRQDAEDIVQETMLKVWSRREQWAEIDSMEAFCLTICHNLALDRVKRMSRQTSTTLDNDTLDRVDYSYNSDPEEQTVQRDRLQIVRQLMDTLPEKQRICIQLRDVEGKPYKEIAAIMAITEEQVKVNIFRARQTIKKKFIENEQYGL
ncbi:MAG: RNA polymerase sigma factor [Prevotella sp.]|nr:RNA polymerase sigma factor [Prevotella sp.]